MSRVLFIIPKNDVGGAPKFVIEQIAICNEAGYSCYLATNGKGWIHDFETTKLADSLLDKRIEKLTSTAFLWKLIQFIRRHKIELVVCNSANGGLYGRLAGFVCGIASVYVSHGWSSVYNGGKFAFVLNLIERGLSMIGTKVLCISRGDVEKATERVKVSPNKIVHINNAIFPVQAKVRDTSNSDKVRILSVTRFRHPKRADLLIDGFALLATKNPLLELHLVGGGEDRALIQQRVTDTKLNQIYLHGEIDQFNHWHNYDVFVLISDSEGLPMSAIEAMSAGLPLLLSNVGGCPELIHNNGLLCENTAEVIAENLEKIIENIQEYSRQSELYFQNHFNLNNRKNEFLSLYANCISS